MERKEVYLAIPERLLCDCIESGLQRADRVIHCPRESLDQLRRRADGLPAPDLMIVRAGAETGTFSAIREIRLRWTKTRWIVLSRVIDVDFVREAVESGVDGFLLEDSPLEVLRLLTDLVLLGHSLLPTHLAEVLGERVANLPSERAPFTARRIGPTALFERRGRALSTRELEILRCVSEGLSNKMIARELDIAEATVKAHVKALLRKMQVANRTQAAIAAPGLLGDLGRHMEVDVARYPLVPSDVGQVKPIPLVASIVHLRSAVG